MLSWSWYSISWIIKKPNNDLPFLPERMKLEKVERFVKASFKSWVNFEKSW